MIQGCKGRRLYFAKTLRRCVFVQEVSAKSSERVTINGIIFRVKAVQINKLLVGDKTFKTSEG